MEAGCHAPNHPPYINLECKVIILNQLPSEKKLWIRGPDHMARTIKH